LVAGSAISREWYRLRMRSRHELMSSLSLSRRVPVLTGRYHYSEPRSRYLRGSSPPWATMAPTIGGLGRIGMLTGDDKKYVVSGRCAADGS